MIKFFLVAIITLAIIGGAIRFESDEHSWQLIINKQGALHSFTYGGIRIYNIVENLFSGSDISDTSSIVIEES